MAITTRKQSMSRRGWSATAEKGLDKFTRLKTSNAMRAYKKKYSEAGKKGGDEDFYEFVARARLRKSSK